VEKFHGQRPVLNEITKGMAQGSADMRHLATRLTSSLAFLKFGRSAKRKPVMPVFICARCG
jgi:hypothetical protein